MTATAADVRTNELIDAQNNLTKGLQDQGDRFDNFDSQISKLTEELRNFEGQAGDGAKGGFLIRYHTHLYDFWIVTLCQYHLLTKNG